MLKKLIIILVLALSLASPALAVFFDMHVVGIWNAATNDKGLVSGRGQYGDSYMVGTSGTTNLDGISVWNVGDVVYFGLNDKWNKLLGSLSNNGEINAADYGMKCDGTPAVDAIGLQAAINTGKPVYIPALGGRCVLDDANIVMATPAQPLRGDGRRATKFVIQSNGTGVATLIFATGRNKHGPVIEDIGFYFAQPTTITSPSAALAYPAAINAVNSSRFVLRRVGIYAAYDGVLANGSADGFDIDDMEISAWHKGLQIDGQVDSVRINSYRWWPYSGDYLETETQNAMLTATQFPAWFSQGSDRVVGIDIAHCDDCKISNSLFLGGLGLNIHPAADSSYPFGSIVNTQLDTLSGLVMTGGSFSMDGGGVSVGDSYGSANTLGVTINGGRMSFNGVQWNYYTPATGATQNLNPLLLVQNVGTIVSVSNSVVEMGNLDRTAFENAGGDVVFTNNTFNHSAANYTYALVNQGAGGLTFIGNRVILRGNGTMLGIYADAGTHRIIGNYSGGYTLTCPNGAVVAMSAGCTTANGGNASSVYFGN